MYRGIKGLSVPPTLSSWIYRITTHTCFDALEKQRLRRASPLQDDPPGVTFDARADIPTPEEGALRAELRRCLDDTLRALNPADRALLVLREIEGRPYQEIAETLATGLSAVKMRIHRARLAFQQLFGTICPGLYRAGHVGPT